MESGLYISKGGSTTPRSDAPAVIKLKSSPAQTAAAAAKAVSEAAGDSPAAALPEPVNPLGSVIHQNLADRLKAAKVPGHAGSHNMPPGQSLHLVSLHGLTGVKMFCKCFHKLSHASVWLEQQDVCRPSIKADGRSKPSASHAVTFGIFQC